MVVQMGGVSARLSFLLHRAAAAVRIAYGRMRIMSMLCLSHLVFTQPRCRHEFEWKREECFMIRKPDPAVLVAVTKEPPGRLKTTAVQILDYNLNRCVD